MRVVSRVVRSTTPEIGVEGRPSGTEVPQPDGADNRAASLPFSSLLREELAPRILRVRHVPIKF
jgi:hypothetical protein